MSRMFNLRMTDDEYAQLQELSDALRETKAAVLRRLIERAHKDCATSIETMKQERVAYLNSLLPLRDKPIKG